MCSKPNHIGFEAGACDRYLLDPGTERLYIRTRRPRSIVSQSGKQFRHGYLKQAFMHVVQVKVGSSLGDCNIGRYGITRTERHQGKVHTCSEICLEREGGVALWLDCGCAVSIAAPLMMTCNAMRVR